MIFLLSPLGGTILNGFNYSSFRWTFLLTFVKNMISIQFLSHYRINSKLLVTSLVFYIVCLGVVANTLQINIQLYSLQITVFALVLVFMTGDILVLTKQLDYSYLSGIFVLELALFLFITFQTPYFNQFTWSEILIPKVY